jgi:uncharacterized protein YigE (DUF2233 family)
VARVRVPVGRVAILLALIVGAWAIARETRMPRWKTVAPGVEFATLRGDPYCRRGSSVIAILRLDPAQVDLRVLHYSLQPDRTPLTILDWQRRLRALAVFNAGQYYPDYSYMGLLVSGGEAISPRPHPRYRAALVAAPVAGGVRARVLDLDQTPFDEVRPRWREVAQSFMLFDARGTVRVRKSEQFANRTAVAEDRRGHIVVIASEGGYTLHEFAQLLERSPLGLSHAMSMDGGREAELVVSLPDFHYASFAPWVDAANGAGSVPLPAVIAVMSR